MAKRKRVAPIAELALVFADGGDRVVLAHARGAAPVVGEVPAEPAAVSAWLESQGGLGSDAVVRSVVAGYGARTRICPTAALATAADVEVSEYLVDTAAAAASDATGFFDASLDELACDWARLPDGRVAVTDATQEQVQHIGQRFAALLLLRESGERLQIETRLRALLRAHVESSGATGAGPTALLALGVDGFAFGLWSPEQGLVCEFEEGFELRGEAEEASESSIQHALGRLGALVARAESYGLNRVDRLVFAMSPTLPAAARSQLEALGSEWRLLSGEQVGGLEVVVARGLLQGRDVIPEINLALDLRARVDQAELAAVVVRRAQETEARGCAVFALLAPLLIALGYVFSSWGYQAFERVRGSRQHALLAQEAARLAPVAAERRSAIEHINLFQALVTQILERRERQRTTVRLFDDLNTVWPADDTWYVKEMRVSAAGALELKGLTRRAEAVATFGRSLEGASGGSFRNVSTATETGAGATLPAAAGGSAAGLPALAAGVTAWTVKADYTPLGGKQ